MVKALKKKWKDRKDLVVRRFPNVQFLKDDPIWFRPTKSTPLLKLERIMRNFCRAYYKSGCHILKEDGCIRVTLKKISDS